MKDTKSKVKQVKMPKFLALFLAFAMVFNIFTVFPTVSVAQAINEVNSEIGLEINLPTNTSGGNILHAWNMSFNEIINQLPDIAAAGFNTIQTSPIGQSLFQFPHYDGPGNPTSQNIRDYVGTWWMLYQPTKFAIGNMLGTEAEFRALTAAAEEFGIGIIVDAIPNHTTSWWYEIDESLRRPDFFHAVPGDGSEWDRNISNWGSRAESRRARLLGLVDFYTGNPELQALYIQFLEQIIDAGAIGFRYDAMVHIELPEPWDAPEIASDFWPNIQSAVDTRILQQGRVPFQYGEILGRWHADYIDALPGMAVTACPYGYHIRDNVIHGRLGNWDTTNFFTNTENATPDRFVTWVESHDTYGNAGASRGITDAQMRVGWAIITARYATTPLFLVRPGVGFENNGQMFYERPDGSFGNTWGHDDFFQDATIVETNWFANYFNNQPEHTSTHFNQVALIERGQAGATTGVVIVNSGTTNREVNFPVQMVDGEYIDQVSGNTYTVANGRITGPAVSGQSVLVIYGQTARNPQPRANALPGTTNFFDFDGISVTLTANHSTESTYQIISPSGVVLSESTFVNGDTIIIGENAQPGDVFTLILTATDGITVNTEYFYYTFGNPIPTRIEFTHPSWQTVRAWGWHTGGGNIFQADWNTAPLMTWDNEVDAFVIEIDPNVARPFNLMFHNSAGAQTISWNIVSSTRIDYQGSGVATLTSLPEAQPTPVVGAIPGTTQFFDEEGLTVSLNSFNTQNRHFTLTGPDGNMIIEEQFFRNGDEINIGKNAQTGETFTLTLVGILGDIEITETFVYTRGDSDGIRVEFAHDAWELVRIWGWHEGGGNIFDANWHTAPLMEWDVTVDAWVYTISPTNHPNFNLGRPFNVMFHNGIGAQLPTGSPYWLINQSMRIEIINGQPVFIPLTVTEPINTRALENLINMINELNLLADNFTTNSWLPFTIALNEAISLLTNDLAIQTQIDNAYNILRQTFENLIPREGENNGIRIEFVHEVWQEVRIWAFFPSGGGNVFNVSWQNAPLLEWCNLVEAWVFYFDEDITGPFYIMFHNGQGQQVGENWLVNESTRIEQIEGVWTLRSLNLGDEPVCKENLANLVEQISLLSLQAENYTFNSWYLFNRAYNSATNLLNNDYASNAQVDAAYLNLRIALESLIILAELDHSEFIRVEFVQNEWDLVRIWAYRPDGGGNVFEASWNTAPLMTFDETIEAWVFYFDTTMPAPFNVMFHNGIGNQEGRNWFIETSSRFEFIEGSWVQSEISEIYVQSVSVSARVTQLNGNTNDLHITIIETLSNQTEISTTQTFNIRNNSSGTYQITTEFNTYNVFVNTQGNTQIRELFIK